MVVAAYSVTAGDDDGHPVVMVIVSVGMTQPVGQGPHVVLVTVGVCGQQLVL